MGLIHAQEVNEGNLSGGWIGDAVFARDQVSAEGNHDIGRPTVDPVRH